MTAMRPSKPVNYQPGPPIKPASALLKWLQNQAGSSGGRKRLRLPVVIRFEDDYRIDIGDAFIGKTDKDSQDDAIFLALDDTALGVSLVSTIKDMCPDDASFCAVWLEGFWGALLDTDESDHEADTWEFAVLKVAELIGANETHLTAFIEA